MPAYALLAAPRAQKELDALPPRVADGLRQVLRAFAATPRGAHFDVKPLRALGQEPPALRWRVGDYRVVLQVDHEAREIRIATIGHRQDIYRGLGAAFA